MKTVIFCTSGSRYTIYTLCSLYVGWTYSAAMELIFSVKIVTPFSLDYCHKIQSWWVGSHRTSTPWDLASWIQGQTLAPWLMGSKTMLSPAANTLPFLGTAVRIDAWHANPVLWRKAQPGKTISTGQRDGWSLLQRQVIEVLGTMLSISGNYEFSSCRTWLNNIVYYYTSTYMMLWLWLLRLPVIIQCLSLELRRRKACDKWYTKAVMLGPKAILGQADLFLWNLWFFQNNFWGFSGCRWYMHVYIYIFVYIYLYIYIHTYIQYI